MGLTQALLPYVADELTGGAELVEIYCTTALIGMHLRDAAKGDVLRVAWWTGDGYQMVDKVVGEDFSLDTVHVSAGEVSMEVEGQEYALKLRNGNSFCGTPPAGKLCTFSHMLSVIWKK